LVRQRLCLKSSVKLKLQEPSVTRPVEAINLLMRLRRNITNVWPS